MNAVEIALMGGFLLGLYVGNVKGYRKGYRHAYQQSQILLAASRGAVLSPAIEKALQESTYYDSTD